MYQIGFRPGSRIFLVTWLENFILFLFIQIHPEEKLPECICSICLEKLETIRQFRLLCLHSDRVLRNELSSILQQSNSISVLPAGLNGNVDGASTFVDQSGNQVILLTNRDNNNGDDPEQHGASTYYILQDSSEHRQLERHVNTQIIEDDEIIVPSKTEEDLILIEGDEDDTPTNDEDPDLVITNVQSIGEQVTLPNRRRTLNDSDDDVKGKKKTSSSF